MSYFTPHALRASDRYGVFTETVRASYMAATLTDSILQPGMRRRLAEAHIFAGASYVAAETPTLNRAIREIAEKAIAKAIEDTGVYIDTRAELEALSEHLREIEEYILGQINSQRLRDVKKLDRMTGDLLLRIHRNARGRHSVRNALAKFRANITEQNFYFMNRAGARLNSKLYIKSVWRQNLLWLFNDVYMNVLAGQEIGEVEVIHPRGGGMWHGKVLSISPETSPSYDEVKEKIFYPNSAFTIKALK